jgi:hypothetical protein
MPVNVFAKQLREIPDDIMTTKFQSIQILKKKGGNGMAMKYTRLAFLLLMFVSTSKSYADNWVYLSAATDGNGNDIIAEVNKPSIEEINSKVKRAEYRFNYSKFPGGADRGLIEFRFIADFDCVNDRIKYLKSFGINRQNEVVSSKTIDVPFFEDTKKTSLIYQVLGYTCDVK